MQEGMIWSDIRALPKSRRYDEVREALLAMLGDERDVVAWMATVSAALREAFGWLWVGFYRLEGDELVVGPYQGAPACLRIPVSRGVCGACVRRGETVLVPDVRRFADHIVCDSRSRSEIVVPVRDGGGALRAVLDVDSDELAAFDETDRQGLERLVAEMAELSWTRRP
ncbi:MAG: GAF domain-containing protein [Acidobacteriota bacterium]